MFSQLPRIFKKDFSVSASSIDTFIYLATILICVHLSDTFKQITDINLKKNYGAGLGLLVTFVVCGWRVIYLIIMVWGNLVIMKCCNKLYMHHVSLCFTLLYMVYLHRNILYNWYMKWIFEIVALRMMGISFSIHNQKYTKTTLLNPNPLTHEPPAIDIVCYGFCYLGIHKGPYYRYKTFDDYFTQPYGIIGSSRVVTIQKLRNSAICGLLHLLLASHYNSSLFYKDEFYSHYASDYRFLYNAPQLLMYFLFCQTTISLCISAFSEAGFGVYPAKTTPIPGYGPSNNLDMLRIASQRLDLAMELEYNYNVLLCYDFKKLLIGPRMKDTLSGWNMATRRWFIENMYTSFLKSNEEVRSACSFVAWTLWSGANISQFIMAITFWVYIHLEAEYTELCKTSMDEELKAAWDVGSSIFRILCLIYLTPCLIIDDSRTVLRYYNSIYWIYHVMLLLLMVSSILIYKKRVSSAMSQSTMTK